jgi:uroporphyrinogen-III decarboxylase
MKREYYHELAKAGLRMPVGADLVLQEKPEAEQVRCNGQRLGRVVIEAACRYNTPLAFPLMDLTVEKERMTTILGIPAAESPTYHFHECLTDDEIARLEAGLDSPLTTKMQANVDSLRTVIAESDRLPVGMSIGPFSLMTKLIADPIAPIYLAGSGVSVEEDADVRLVEQMIDLSVMVILRSLKAQFEAGAKAVFICEPAANIAYMSPRQLNKGSDIFERFVMAPNRKIKALLDEMGVDLILHDCGELTDQMVCDLATLDPVILSLGSSRTLWEDAARVPKQIVLYGNLPTKKFYSDDLVPRDQVPAMTCELIRRMKEVGHPFILGSECDVLSVPGSETTIKEKVAAFLRCDCG